MSVKKRVNSDEGLMYFRRGEEWGSKLKRFEITINTDTSMYIIFYMLVISA